VRPIFIDTGAWVALLNARDRWHVPAAAYWERSLSERARFLTTNYVTAETATHLRATLGLRVALRFRQALARAAEDGTIRVRWIDPRLEAEAWRLLERYADVPLSLTDATSAVVSHRAKVREVFGFDSDFRALGFHLQPIA
jgi:predicted nucleic acid-binding protein